MNNEIKEKWVKALRSGEYQQGFGYLQKEGHYCVIGVLCAINPEFTAVTFDGITKYNGTAFLPDMRGLLPIDMAIELADRNDLGESFDKLADYIERNL